MAAESAWCWPWLSSATAWFLFFNAVVGMVAVLSWVQGGDAEMSRRRRLTRSASSMVMERLRSMSVFAAFHSAPEHDYGSLASPASQSRLHHVQEYYTSTSSQGGGGEEVGHVVKPEPVLPATMAPSTPAAPDTAAAHASMSGSDDRTEAETRTEVSRCLGNVCAVVTRQREAPRRTYAEMEEKAEVNAQAERFIRQFREELKLERIKSILSRGRAAATSAR